VSLYKAIHDFVTSTRQNPTKCSRQEVKYEIRIAVNKKPLWARGTSINVCMYVCIPSISHHHRIMYIKGFELCHESDEDLRKETFVFPMYCCQHAMWLLFSNASGHGGRITF